MSKNKPAKVLSPVEALRHSVMQMTMQFQAALPKHISVDKFIRTILTAANTNPKLVSADRNTFFSSCMKAASDGLLPDGKEAALVPFNQKGGGINIQYLPMAAGILKKLRNSGQLASIDAKIVFSGDQFDYWVDEKGPHIMHKPADVFGDVGEARGVYAIAILKDGSFYFEPLSIKDIEAIRNVSRSKDSGPWSGPFEHEMWKKSAIRRLAKRLPQSTDIERTFEHDDEDYEFNNQQAQLAAPTQTAQIEAPKEVTESKPQDKTKPSKLSKMISEDINEEKEPEQTSETQESDDII